MPSPQGTTGRVSDFEGGHIHWSTGAPEAYETHGSIDALYVGMGGTPSWLGFPLSDEFVNPSGEAQNTFEGGFITTLDGFNYCPFANPPNLASPANGSSVSTLTPTLNWSSAWGADAYDVAIHRDSCNGALVHLASAASTSYTVSGGILDNGTDYYWKVASKNNNACGTTVGPDSDCWSFTTQIGVIPNDLVLSNNTISQPNLYEACNSITLGPGLFISGGAPGVTLRAPTILFIPESGVLAGALVSFHSSVPAGCP